MRSFCLNWQWEQLDQPFRVRLPGSASSPYSDFVGNLRAVGFDLDGTLFDHRSSARMGLDWFLSGLGTESTEELRTAWFAAESEQFERWRAGQISFQEQRRERLRIFLPMIGLSAPSNVGHLAELFSEYLRSYRAAWRPFSDSAEVLRILRESGYRVGVLTNGTQEQQVDKLTVIGLLGAFDVVCTSEQIGAQKPDPYAFVEFAKRLEILPSACLFVGDSAEQDFAGARGAGMRALLINRYGDHAEGIASIDR